MGRPKKQPDERRDTRIPDLRVTVAERLFVEEQAAKAGLPLADYQRRLLLGHRVTVPASKTDKRLIHEVNMIGVNLHQLVRHQNFGGTVAAAEVETVLAKLDAILDQIVAAHGS